MAKRPNRFPLKKPKGKKPKPTTALATMKSDAPKSTKKLATKGAEKKEPDLYTGMMDEHSMIVEMGRAEKRIREADRAVENAKGDLKAARGEQHSAVKAMRDLATDAEARQKRVNLDAEKKAEPEAALPASPADTNGKVLETEGLEINWRSKLISVLGFGKRLVDKLVEANINTMGDLNDRANVGNLPEELKMTDAERDMFGEKTDAFYKAHKVGSYAEVAS